MAKRQHVPGGEERIQGHLGIFKASGRNLLCLENGSIRLEISGESVWSGLRIVLTGLGRRSDHFWQNGNYKKFVSMVVRLD